MSGAHASATIARRPAGGRKGERTTPQSDLRNGPVQDGWEPFFWLVFDRSSVPMAIGDDRRVIIAANAAISQYLGRPRSELVGSNFRDFAAPSSVRAQEEAIARLDRFGMGVSTIEVIRSDGVVLRSEWAARETTIQGRRLVLAVLVAGEPAMVKLREREGPLSDRERAVVHLLTLGLTSAEIGRRLSITVATVRTHVRNAMSKTGARTRAQLVAVALAERHTSEEDG